MADQQDGGHGAEATEAKLARKGTVPAAYVAQQVVGCIGLDLDPFHSGPQQQTPTSMIRIRLESRANPAE